jgi:hypothetical protein
MKKGIIYLIQPPELLDTNHYKIECLRNNNIIVPMSETTGYKNTEEYKLEQELKETIDAVEDLFDTKEDMNATIHDIKHPEALYTEPLISEIINQLSLMNPSKKQTEKLEVKQSIDWKKFKFTSFDGTEK